MDALESGALTVRLAVSPAEVAAAQALRYRVFYEEMGARPTPALAAARRDADALDAACDHLLVFDREDVVGTYRLMRRDQARRAGGFYSAGEYDLAPLLAFPGAILELGRSCIDARYRTRPAAMQLLWRGIAAHVFRHGIAVMFGCASLPGTDAEALAEQLAYLHHHHLAPPELRPRALARRRIAMDRRPPEAIDAAAARAALPPLLKGYLRLGGVVGDGAVIDRQFNTTDVCVVVRTDRVTAKYYRHYERTARPS